MKTWMIPIVILAALIVARLFVVFGHDAPISSDELAHFSYASFVNTYETLPRFAEPKQGSDVNEREVYWYQNYQQPGFYMLAAPFVQFGPVGVRLLSLAFWIAGVILLWGVCRKWWMLAFLCLPGVVTLSAMITNQSLEFFAACVLAYGLHEDSDWTIALAAVVLSLARVTGLAVCVGLAGWYLLRQDKRLFLPMPGIAIGLWVFIDRLPFMSVNSFALQDVYRIIENTGHAIVTGVYSPTIAPAGWMFGLGCVVLAACGVIIARYWRWFIGSERGVVVATCAAILAWFTVTHGFSEGRLLYAAVPFVIVKS